MNPALFALGKQILAKAILKKVEKEVVKIDEESDDTIKGTVGVIEEAYEIDKGKGAIWAFIIAVIGFAASQGYIDAGLAQAIIELLSNEAVQDAVEGAVENVGD